METKILIVEDEAIVAESISSKLRRYGYMVAGITSAGEDAITFSQKNRPDVVLMDIHLAGKMDGIEAAGVISKNYRIPVVFLTAYADDLTLERAKGIGPFGYLVKPFRERDLHVSIEMACVRSRLEAELEAANKELDSFSYSVSHDLRGPLIAIEGFSRILEMDYAHLLPDDGKECVQRIHDAAVHMDAMVNDFLRLSRVSRQDMVMRPVNLSELAEKIRADLTEQDPERRVEWVIEPDLMISGDQNLLEIALQNLIANAWKYSGKKELSRIEVGSCNWSGSRTVFIRDNGAGFPMEKVDRLFIPLQRLHNQSEFPGTGIGLATVQRIINRHGGKVWGESVLGEGATFFFTLPDGKGT